MLEAFVTNLGRYNEGYFDGEFLRLWAATILKKCVRWKSRSIWKTTLIMKPMAKTKTTTEPI